MELTFSIYQWFLTGAILYPLHTYPHPLPSSIIGQCRGTFWFVTTGEVFFTSTWFVEARDNVKYPALHKEIFGPKCQQCQVGEILTYTESAKN